MKAKTGMLSYRSTNRHKTDASNGLNFANSPQMI